MITAQERELATIIWDYLHMGQELEACDCLLALGSQDTRVAEWAADLYLQGWAPLLVLSGGWGRLTKEAWKEPEAERFARIAIEKGVPAEAVLTESRSTNTGDNILFTRQLLESRGLDPHRILLVQKPYAERRSYASFLVQWPGKKLIVSSPPLSFEDYPTPELPMRKVINIMVGDLQRIRLYPAKGFQVYQRIPEKVWEAYEQLVALGFDEQLVRE